MDLNISAMSVHTNKRSAACNLLPLRSLPVHPQPTLTLEEKPFHCYEQTDGLTLKCFKYAANY
jgi:hypothetical protein